MLLDANVGSERRTRRSCLTCDCRAHVSDGGRKREEVKRQTRVAMLVSSLTTACDEHFIGIHYSNKSGSDMAWLGANVSLPRGFVVGACRGRGGSAPREETSVVRASHALHRLRQDIRKARSGRMCAKRADVVMG